MWGIVPRCRHASRAALRYALAEFSEAAKALGAFWLRFNELAPVVRGA
jgi:hypothetical protein